MSRFKQGQVITLKSDKSITGAIVNIMEGYPETRYQVFTAAGMQTYYESQIDIQESDEEMEKVNAERFNAGLTASLIRNPSISSLYSLNTAKIDFIPHQFRPVLKFIRADRPRLLIADGVGVGKTIEAGLILRELQARRNLDSVLIICPRPLVSERKWEEEMKRFGEEFTALDGDLFRHCINELDMEGEWPEKYKKAIIPYSLFDESNVFGNKKHKGLMEVDPPEFDLVIVDEAHHIRNTATYGYRAVSRFCDAAEAVVLLTATPVQLQYDDLFVLLNLLRPDLIIDRKTFQDMAEPNQFINMASTYVRGFKEGWKENAYEQIINACNTSWGKKVFQGNPTMEGIIRVLNQNEISVEERVQLISDIENMHTFSNLISRTRRRDIGEFTIRKPYTVTVEFTPEQRELHDKVLEVVHEIFSTIHCTDNTKFMMTTIRRQTASCLFGLAPMLRSILYRHLYEITDNDDESIDLSALNHDKSLFSIQEQIEEILEIADALPDEDPKFDALMEIVKKKQTETKNKLMIFSSFRHTLHYLYNKLTEQGLRVSITHPLVKLAADYLQSKGKVVTSLRVESNQFAAGVYPFAIYQWKLSGEREDIQMTPVSSNTNLNRILFELLKQSCGVNYLADIKEESWKAVDATHHSFWTAALKEHKEKTEEMINYKEASLRTSHTARMKSLEDALKNNSGKKNYIQMMTGKIRIAQEDYDLHMHQLEDAKSKADILFELLAYGVLDVEPDSQKAVNQSMLDTMKYIRNQYGLEILESPRRLLGLISDLAPEQFNERRKLKLLFDIGVVDQLKSNPENIERVIQMTETELGFTEEETKKYIQYLTVFMEKDSKNGVI